MMVTSAGRLRKNSNHGLPRRSISCERPMTKPTAMPIDIASAKLAATRSSVTARWYRSSPSTISSTSTAKTVSGAGMKRGFAACDAAICQTPSSSRIERPGSRMRDHLPAAAGGPPMLVPGAAGALSRAVLVADTGPECAIDQYRRTADQLLAAKLSQHGIELFGGLALRVAPAVHDALPVAALERVEGRVVLGLGQRSQALPLLVALVHDRF